MNATEINGKNDANTFKEINFILDRLLNRSHAIKMHITHQYQHTTDERQHLLLDFLLKQQRRITNVLQTERNHEKYNIRKTFNQYLPDTESVDIMKSPCNTEELISQALDMNQSIVQPIDYLSEKNEIASVSTRFTKLKEFINRVLKEMSGLGQTVNDV